MVIPFMVITHCIRLGCVYHLMSWDIFLLRSWPATASGLQMLRCLPFVPLWCNCVLHCAESHDCETLRCTECAVELKLCSRPVYPWQFDFCPTTASSCSIVLHTMYTRLKVTVKKQNSSDPGIVQCYQCCTAATWLLCHNSDPMCSQLLHSLLGNPVHSAIHFTAVQCAWKQLQLSALSASQLTVVY